MDNLLELLRKTPRRCYYQENRGHTASYKEMECYLFYFFCNLSNACAATYPFILQSPGR